MFKLNYNRKIGLAISMFVAVLALFGPAADRAQAKDNDAAPKIKVRIEVAGVTGDGLGGSIDGFGSDQLLTLTESTVGGGGGAGKAAFGPLVITKDVDSATPKLFLKSAQGFHITFVKISWIRKNPLTGLDETYFAAMLEDVLITSLRTRLADQRDPQSLQGAFVEEVAFNFSKVQLSFFRPDGSVVSGGFDVKNQTSSN